MKTKTVFHIITALLLAPGVLRAGTAIEHLGSPPPGLTFLELQTELSTAPLQLAGTIDPPSLLLNGKPLQFSSDEPAPSGKYGDAGPALWINGEKRPVEGSMGRFFLKLQGADAAVATLDIVMRSQAGAYFKATAAVNRTFLDAPIRITRILEPDDEKKDKHLFRVEGSIPPKATLTIEGSTPVQTSASAFDCELPVGKSILIARVRMEDGSERILNIATTVSVLKFSQERPILSLEVPEGQQVGSTVWSVAPEGVLIRGTTNVGARFFIDDEPVAVEADGTFVTRLIPRGKERNFTLHVALPSGGGRSYSKRLLCKDCPEPSAVKTEPSLFTRPPAAKETSDIRTIAYVGISRQIFATAETGSFQQFSHHGAVNLRWSPHGSNWIGMGDISMTIVPLHSNVPNTTATFIHAVASLGYDLSLLPAGWKTVLFAGVTYSQMKVSTGSFGHNPYGYPHFFPSLTREFNDRSELSIFAKYVPLSREAPYLSFEKRELAFGISWTESPAEPQPLSLSLQFSSTEYDMSEDVEARKANLALQFGFAF